MIQIKKNFQINFKYLLLIILIIQSSYQLSYDVTSQAKLDAAFNSIANEPNKASITEIRLNGSITSRSGITDLSGISSFSQLTGATSLFFNFNYGSLTDITPLCNSVKNLSQLKKFELHLYVNSVSNITCLQSVLTNMPNLERFAINMTGNGVSEIKSVTTPVKNMHNLTYMYLNFSSNSGITEISGLADALQNKTKVTQVNLYFYSTNVTTLLPIQNSFSNLLACTHMYIRFDTVDIQEFELQQSFKDMPKLIVLYLWLGPRMNSGITWQNFYIESPTLTHFYMTVRDTTYHSSSTQIFNKMPNLERLYFIIREGYKYSEMKFVMDQIQNIDKLWYIYIEFHYGNDSQYLDLSEWSNLFSVTDGANKVKWFQFMNNYSYQQVNWNQLQTVINDLPNLETLHLRQHSGRSGSMQYINNISHPNLWRIYIYYTDGAPVTFSNLQDVLGTVPKLTHFYYGFNNQGWDNSDLTDFGLIYKSFQNRVLKHFFIYMNSNLITDMSAIGNKSGQSPFECNNWCYIYCQNCDKLTSLNGLKSTLESIFIASKQNYIHFYLQNSAISDITALQTAFDNFVNIKAVYLNLENNQITNWNQLQGLYDNKSSYLHAKLYFKDNAMTNQVALNDVFSPIFWQGGPPLINDVYFQFMLNSVLTTSSYTGMKSNKRYITFTDDGYCLSTYSIAKYYYIDEQGNSQCADCNSSNCHLCVNNTACTKCRWSTVARVLPSCNCPTGYYDGAVNYECDQCNRVCISCSNNTSCDTCVTSNPARILASFCACPVKYYDSGVDQCSNCISNCDDCDNGSTCQTCTVGYYKNSSNTCTQCLLKFASCSDQTTGITCQGNNRTSTTPNCSCQSGYVDVDGTNLKDCVACTSPCKTCVNQKTKCLSCVDGYYLSGNTCVKCPNKYAKCTSPTNGTLCQGTNRSSTTPSCPCNSKFYDDGTNADCPACTNNCETCNSATYCNTCLQGYYLDSNTCPQCPLKFETCDDISTGTKCQGANRTSTTPNCSCQSGYVDVDGTNLKDCVACTSPCKTCVNQKTKCLSCVDGYYLSGNTCVKCPNKYAKCTSPTNGTLCQGTNRSSTTPSCPCNSKFYDDGTNADCPACTNNCETCNSATYCNTCLQGYYLDNNTCPQCPLKFETCDDISTGTKCQGANRTSTTPNCSCQPGYVDVDGTNLKDCVVCSDPCKTCISQKSTCQSCIDGYYLDGNSCPMCLQKFEKCSDLTTGEKCQGNNRTANLPNCECQDGYVDVNGTDQKDCVQCTSNCKTCVDQQNKCLSCIDGYYLDGTNCVKCQEKFATCQDQNTGLTCQGNNRKTTVPCECENGYYDDNTNADCVQCVYPCVHCSSQATCITCHDNINRNQDCSCESGYFDKDQSCQKCHNKCATCQSEHDSCQTCNDSENREQSQNCICKDGYYDLGNTLCELCISPCQYCTSASVCTQCLYTGDNRLTTPSCQCEDGYYEDQDTHECKKCSSKCSKCSDYDTCTECDSTANTYRSLDLNKNCACQDQYYEDESENLLCQACQYPCVNCSSANQCILNSCVTSINRNSDCSCQPGYYDNGSICQVCSKQCKECSGSADNCEVECSDTETRENFPTCNCIEGLKEIGQSQCGVCDNKCQECFGSPSTCTLCVRGLGRSQEVDGLQDKDKCKCQIGYYDDGINNDCQVCGSQCKTCSNGYSCDSCLIESLDPKQNCMEQAQKSSAVMIFDEVLQQYVETQCAVQCETCEQDITNCLTCTVGLQRLNNPPHCQCKDGYHDYNGTHADCSTKCNYTCKTCSNSNTCNVCPQDRQLDPMTLLCKCLDNHYENNDKVCIPCLFKYKGKCVGECPKNTYINQKQQTCEDFNFNASQSSNIVIYSVFLIIAQILAFGFLAYKIGSIFKNKYLSVPSSSSQVNDNSSSNSDEVQLKVQ